MEALGAAGKNVIITDDVPNFSFDPKQCKYSRLFGEPNNCIQESAFFSRQLHTYYPTLQYVAQTHSNVKLLDTAKEFCDSRFCSMAHAGQVLYRDNNHLNLNGTRYLARKVAEENSQLFRLKK